MAIRRRSLFLLVIVICFFAVIGVVVFVFVDPDRYRPEVISYLEAKTGKQVELGHVGVIWFPLSVRLDDFGTRNPKPFPPGYFLKAKRIDASIEATALLYRQIVIKSLVLYDPIVNVVSDPDGLWNFENRLSKNSLKGAPIFALGVIPQVQIAGGEVLGS